MALGLSTGGTSIGVVLVSATGISGSAQSIKFSSSSATQIKNTAGASSMSSDLFSPQLNVSVTYNVTVYSGLNATGTVLQSGSISATATVAAPTVTFTTTDAYTGCSWNFPTESNSSYVYAHTTLRYSVNGGAVQTYGTVTSGTSIPNNSVFVGYSANVTWYVQHNYYSSTYGNADGSQGSGAGTVGGPPVAPPAAPNPVTGLGATDNTTNIVLNWTASAGGASGYQIKRGGVIQTTTTNVTWTDTSPPARPVTYTVTAYNTNSGGTTYAAGVDVIVGAGGGTVQQTQQMIL